MKQATKRTCGVFFYENMHEPEVNSGMKDMYAHSSSEFWILYNCSYLKPRISTPSFFQENSLAELAFFRFLKTVLL